MTFSGNPNYEAKCPLGFSEGETSPEGLRFRYSFCKHHSGYNSANNTLRNILNVYTEFNPSTRKKKYDHAGTGSDDFLHLCNYARI